MQFRLTLNPEDEIESAVLARMEGLNIRRRAEYLRRLVARGFLAELGDLELVRASKSCGVGKKRVHPDGDNLNRVGLRVGRIDARGGTKDLLGVFGDQDGTSIQNKTEGNRE